jgi:hypothetical protein
VEHKQKAITAVSLTQHKLMHLRTKFSEALMLLLNELPTQLESTFKELQRFL